MIDDGDAGSDNGSSRERERAKRRRKVVGASASAAVVGLSVGLDRRLLDVESLFHPLYRQLNFTRSSLCKWTSLLARAKSNHLFRNTCRLSGPIEFESLTRGMGTIHSPIVAQGMFESCRIESVALIASPKLPFEDKCRIAAPLPPPPAE